mmetsp:Transcript_32369/g.77724  ORF Transcript_32369/g.77724 Transcript_32369/m.77724 type:complete len:201 (-) Transcript_32369:2027-2629(-)
MTARVTDGQPRAPTVTLIRILSQPVAASPDLGSQTSHVQTISHPLLLANRAFNGLAVSSGVFTTKTLVKCLKKSLSVHQKLPSSLFSGFKAFVTAGYCLQRGSPSFHGKLGSLVPCGFLICTRLIPLPATLLSTRTTEYAWEYGKPQGYVCLSDFPGVPQVSATIMKFCLSHASISFHILLSGFGVLPDWPLDHAASRWR